MTCLIVYHLVTMKSFWSGRNGNSDIFPIASTRFNQFEVILPIIIDYNEIDRFV